MKEEIKVWMSFPLLFLLPDLSPTERGRLFLLFRRGGDGVKERERERECVCARYQSVGASREALVPNEGVEQPVEVPHCLRCPSK